MPILNPANWCNLSNSRDNNERFNIKSLIIYRDEDLLALNKPSGIAVHKGIEDKVSLDDFFDELCFELPRPPALAHRLDKDTSGCLILGRDRKALRKLGELFRNQRIKKTYWAVVHGTPSENSGTINLPLKKIDSENKKSWWMKIDESGAASITDYRVLKVMGETSWLELTPKTGRTHQIRIHLSALGCPIVGDGYYGRQNQPEQTVQLHAQQIEIPMHASKAPIVITATPPAGFMHYLQII